MTPDRLPSALERANEIRRRLDGMRPAVFLDYDGTLTPIVDRPELAVLSDAMRETVRDLARHCTVAIVSGRDRADVQRLVALESLIYAGSHGFDIASPGGQQLEHEGGTQHIPALEQAVGELRERLAGIEGAMVERKKYAAAVHYRLVADHDVAAVREAVEETASHYPDLRRTGGKKIFELRPRLDWDKGKAVLWLLDALELDAPDVLPFYLGDDETDEDAFRALEGRGVAILVADTPGPTRAQYGLRNPDEVRDFLKHLVTILERAR